MSTDDAFELAPAHPGDATSIAQLHRRLLGETDGWSDDGLRRVLTAPAARGWVASAASSAQTSSPQPSPLPKDKAMNEPAGFIIAFAAADEAEVLALCVAPAHRRHGLASTLLRRLAKQLVAEGIVRLHLEVRASNLAAQQLYRRNGFVETGRRKGYYEGTEDAVTMAREISCG